VVDIGQVGLGPALGRPAGPGCRRARRGERVMPTSSSSSATNRHPVVPSRAKEMTGAPRKGRALPSSYHLMVIDHEHAGLPV